MRTNRTTTTDFALSSADTKLRRFDSSFSSGIPFPDGVCFAFLALCETLIAQNHLAEGTLISGVSGPRHSTDAHRGGARCAQNGSALVPKNPLNQLETAHFFPDES